MKTNIIPSIEGVGYICRQIMGLKKLFLFCWSLLTLIRGFSQAKGPGIIAGTVLNEKQEPLLGATIKLNNLADSSGKYFTRSGDKGSFEISNIVLGIYSLEISYTGYARLRIDSIRFRADRSDYNLNELVLNKTTGNLDSVVVYAEKPLVEMKEGNITFNAAQSATAAGSNVNEILNNVPLVSKDANGKITVRGKEPKILIDDKPVELNLQQLQDLLESMPGSSIEKIEVMTNPPPQYANEPGGVINIVTKKGSIGKSGRITASGGTRGEASLNGSYNYRKKGLNFSINIGTGYSRIKGFGHSSRENIYPDSVNFFNTSYHYINKNFRPNMRFNLDYDISKNRSLNFVIQFNENNYHNISVSDYSNLNRFDSVYKLSERTNTTGGDSYSSGTSLTYTQKGRMPGEIFRVISAANFSWNMSRRNFYQQYFNPDWSFTGTDSTQRQVTGNNNTGYSVRVSYDRPLNNKKTFLSTGGYFNQFINPILIDASYFKKPDDIYLPLDLLSNHFRYHQQIINQRISFKHLFSEKFNISAGIAAEETSIRFDLYRDQRTATNKYSSWLPFANLNRTWNNNWGLSLSYRRTIRRPGINELNPAIDFSDPYNLRFGNEKLRPSLSDNLDLIISSSKPIYNLNLALGFNHVKDIFSQIRTLIPGEKTQITWENISNRREYEISTWNSLTLARRLKTNFSASYTYHVYSDFDKTVNLYRDGGSFTSNINTTYTQNDIFNMTGSFIFNRIANPQGYARWTWSMNLGVQRKFLHKKLIITLNVIDPFVQQLKNITAGGNFILQSYSYTQSRNLRLTVAWIISKNVKQVVLPGKNK